MDWLDLLAVQRTLKSLLQHHSSKASILRRSAFFTVQLLHPYMTTGKTIALTRWTFVSKVMSLLLNMLSSLVITFLPRSLGLGQSLVSIWSHHFMTNRSGKNGNCGRVYFLGLQNQCGQWGTLFLGAPKSLQMVTAAMKLKDAYSLEEKLWPT